MIRLVMRAAELIAVAVKERVDEETRKLRAERSEARRDCHRVAHERDYARAELSMVQAELATVRAERDALAERLQEASGNLELESAARCTLFVLSEDEIARLRALITHDDEVGKENAKLAARVTKLKALIDRKQLVNDALRQELVAEQAKLKEAHDCVDRLTSEIRTAKLAALAPAPVEVDGFRVGDLVRFNGDTLPLLDVSFDEAVGYSFGTVECDSPYRRKSCSQLQHMVRKPVEVGDTVRITIGSHAGKRGKLEDLGESDRRCEVRIDESSLLHVPRHYLVAVAP